MKVYCLIDNNSLPGYKKEWGLSLLVETANGHYLIDTGSSGKYVRNAYKMGIDLSEVNELYLSHAHYDHCNGLGKFLKNNGSAPVFVSEHAAENCYSQHRFIKAYIGVKKGQLAKCSDRLVHIPTGGQIYESEEKNLPLIPEMVSIPHFLEPRGGTGSMYVKRDGEFITDTFRHEQTVVVRHEDGGLVVISPCSHLGFEAIISEVREKFPDEGIKGFFGGLHLFRKSDEEVRKLAAVIGKSGVGHIYTGHCTGDRAVAILTEELPGRVTTLAAGSIYEI